MSDVLMQLSSLIPSLVTPATAATEGITVSNRSNLSDDSNSSIFDPLSPLVISLAKSSVLQQVVDSDKSVQFPVTPDPFLAYNNTVSPSSLSNQANSSVIPNKVPKDSTQLQAPTEKKHSHLGHSNDPYALFSHCSSQLVHSLEYTQQFVCLLSDQ